MTQATLNQHIDKPTLIFPAGMPRSLDFLEKCMREGKSVIGSSSLAYDVSKEKYPAWSYLPYINEPDFTEALKQTIAEHNIGAIYSPNPVAWSHIHKTLKEINTEIEMVNDCQSMMNSCLIEVRKNTRNKCLTPQSKLRPV